MPTLTELQRQKSNLLPSQEQAKTEGEEEIADYRAKLRPSQLVDQKLEARTFRSTPQSSRFAALRPRAK